MRFLRGHPLTLAIAATAWLAAPTMSRAIPIMYDLSGVTAVLGGDPVDVTGSFVYDPTTHEEYSADLTLSGGSFAYDGLYNSLPGAPFFTGSAIEAFDASGDQIGLGFAGFPAYDPIGVSDVYVDPGGPFSGSPQIFDNDATGTANPVPEPASLSLFGAALLGLIAVRRRRHLFRGRHIFSTLVAALLALLVNAGTAWSDVIFTDSTFNAGDYSTHVYKSDPTITVTAGQCASCGNPGTAWQVDTTYGSSAATLDLGFLNTTFTYDPATQGPIVSISASLDRNITHSGGGTTQTTWYLLIEQDGNFFAAQVPGPITSVGTWVTVAGSGIDSVDFSEINFSTGAITAGTPNFDGDPMEFGFAIETPTNGPGETVEAFDDNLKIDLAIPEPASIALLGTAIVGLGAVRRRKRGNTAHSKVGK